MTDYEEEQEMELEALAAIFMDEFQPDEADPTKRFTILIIPDENLEFLTSPIKFDFKYTATYPDAPPEFFIQSTLQLTNDMQQRIKETMQAAAEEELGMAMIFSMITAAKVRVFLFHGKHRQQSSHTPRAVQELLMGDFSSEPAEEKKKEEAPQLPPEQRGTPVTKENFVTWNAPFMVELRGRSKQVVKTGLSGRELFEGGLWKEPEPEPDEEPMVELDDDDMAMLDEELWDDELDSDD